MLFVEFQLGFCVMGHRHCHMAVICLETIVRIFGKNRVYVQLHGGKQQMLIKLNQMCHVCFDLQHLRKRKPRKMVVCMLRFVV